MCFAPGALALAHGDGGRQMRPVEDGEWEGCRLREAHGRRTRLCSFAETTKRFVASQRLDWFTAARGSVEPVLPGASSVNLRYDLAACV